MDRSGYGQTFIILISQMTGTVLGTEPAGRTFVGVNITGAQTYFSFKIAGLTLKREEISVTDYFDIWRPTGLN